MRTRHAFDDGGPLLLTSARETVYQSDLLAPAFGMHGAKWADEQTGLMLVTMAIAKYNNLPELKWHLWEVHDIYLK
jgi:hypothetical protein